MAQADVAQFKYGLDTSGTATQLIVTPNSPCVAGRTLIYAVELFNSGVQVSNIDNDSNSWQLIRRRANGTDNWHFEAWKALNNVGGTPSPRLNISAGAFINAWLIEVTNSGDIVGQNDINDNVLADTHLVGGAAATPTGDGLSLAWFGAAGSTAPITASAGWTGVDADTANGTGLEKMIAVNGVSNSPQWTLDATADGDETLLMHIIVANAAAGRRLLVMNF